MSEEFFYKSGIAEIAFDEAVIRVFSALREGFFLHIFNAGFTEAGVFEADIIITVDIIYSQHLVPKGNKFLYTMKSDKPCRACNDYSHRFLMFDYN